LRLDVWSRPERLRDPNAACEARLPGTAGACPERSRRSLPRAKPKGPARRSRGSGAELGMRAAGLRDPCQLTIFVTFTCLSSENHQKRFAMPQRNLRCRKKRLRCRKRCFRRFPSGSQRYLTLPRAGDQAYTSVTAGIRSTAPGLPAGRTRASPSLLPAFSGLCTCRTPTPAPARADPSRLRRDPRGHQAPHRDLWAFAIRCQF
jgi:hypothetical protein